MSLDRIVSQPFFGEVATLKQDAQASLPLGDTAWSEDPIFRMGSQGKYNPDDLIGKKGPGIYRKMMLDEQVKAVVKFKRDAITSRDYFFEVDEEELGEEEAARRIKVCEAILTRMQGNPIDAFNGIMSAMWQGVSYTEKNYAQIAVQGKTYWGLASLKLKPFDTFEFKTDEFGNILELEQSASGKKHKVDARKFIHHVQNPEYDEHYGQSELREAYRAWFGKDLAIKFYNMWLERSAAGYKWIQTAQAPNTPGYNALKTVLSNTVNGAGVILGKDDVFNIAFPGNNTNFKEAVDMHDLAIARALLVPNLMGITPAGQTGSFSQSDTQLEAFLWTLDQDATRLEECVNEQLFRQLGQINFGDDFWPRFRFQPISERRKNGIITLWKDLVQSGAVEASDTDEKHIRQQLDFPEKDDASVGNRKPDASNNEPSNSPDNGVPGPGEGGGMGAGKGKQNDLPDETVMGKRKNLYSAGALTTAMKRVDFKVIQRATETMEQDKAQPITALMYRMTRDAVDQLKVSMGNETIPSVKFQKSDKQKLQRTVNSAIQDFWKVGQRHAENEIDKAKGLAFSMQADQERLKFISEEFFKIKSFKVAGKLTDDAIAIIEQVIANGVKGGKDFKTIELEIYQAMGGAGFMSEEDYKAALGAAVDPELKNPQARIDTMLRTNGFEAVNEARYSYFTDPQLDGFVEALEYSAILDSRTTQICQHLDGHVHATNAAEWESYRPPNHYNCRSLLIPVTQIDNWSESDEPTVEPQKGFA